CPGVKRHNTATAADIRCVACARPANALKLAPSTGFRAQADCRHVVRGRVGGDLYALKAGIRGSRSCLRRRLQVVGDFHVTPRAAGRRQGGRPRGGRGRPPRRTPPPPPPPAPPPRPRRRAKSRRAGCPRAPPPRAALRR